MGSTTHKEQWMTDIDEFMEQLSPIPAFDVTDLIGRLTELGEQYRAAEKIDPSNGYRASRQIDQAIEHLLKADRGFHMALAQAEQRADQAIRRIEDIGASLSAQAYSYRKSGASNRNRPLLAKDLLRLIERVEEAGKVFRSVAKIAK